MALSTIAGSSIDDDAITNAKIADSTINLTSKVTGTLPLANGGIGSTSLSGANIAALNATANFSDNIVQRATLKDTSETVVALGDLGGGTDDLDLSAGNVFTATVSTSTQTFTFSNPAASGTCYTFMLILTNGGSQTVNFPGTVDFAGGTAPSLTASGVDILLFTTVDAGTTYHCIVSSTDSKDSS
tara:strand:+ start:82 stop:639 length:558 start_codon:yes stop_codon:yes gene_type:complete